jgi:hypothetical protein
MVNSQWQTLAFPAHMAIFIVGNKRSSLFSSQLLIECTVAPTSQTKEVRGPVYVTTHEQNLGRVLYYESV